MATGSPFSTRKVCGYFYKLVLDDQDVLKEHVFCRCNVVHTQVPKTDCSNHFSHVLERHPDFMEIMVASETNNTTLVSFIDQKLQTILCRLKRITGSNPPYS
ncbi:hypothetical protein F441_11161 [Phytophthora nicotianae CJ01A1]|uniref:BED-type domain-containing protein n=1 Tax=Phytophthora nicotianae CJ01A1 TaxID=1317063 RepID=W2WW15_PHYNI|nr:hypothetical protein F441_11161 [Phytophthora nicotianae CJ01A1]